MKSARKKTTRNRPAAAFAAGVALACFPGGAALAQTGAPSNLPSLATTTDLFVGRDNPGPYELSWKKLPQVAGPAVCTLRGSRLSTLTASSRSSDSSGRKAKPRG